MADITCTIPYPCDEHETHTWHLKSFGYDEETREPLCCDPFPHDVFEPCDESDFPTAAEEVQAWRDYYRFVLETGTDPVEDCTIPRTLKKTWKYQVRVAPWIGQKEHGVAVVGVARITHGPRIWKQMGDEKIPQELRDFLCAEKRAGRWLLPDYKSIDDLREVIRTDERCREVPIRDRTGNTPGGWYQFEVPIELEFPRPAGTVARELKEWAKGLLENSLHRPICQKAEQGLGLCDAHKAGHIGGDCGELKAEWC